jgi:hypothetical protein
MDGAPRSRRPVRPWLVRAEHVRDEFGLVLVLVLLTYVLTSLIPDRGWGAVVLALSLSATSLVALISSQAAERRVRAAFWILAVSVALTIVNALTDARVWLNLGAAVQIVLLTISMGAVLRRVIRNAGADSRTILGAISVYTVFGLVFTFLYAFIARVQSGPFFEGHPGAGGSDFIFFSYTTLTTTGFGDLVPGGQPGRMIAGLEMMIGQIFLVTLVAGLVSLWRPGERFRSKRETTPTAQVPEPGEGTAP